uniref:Uncharacterized protein n=1 Tax=Vitrella brassicaformis TaxID=1169539 RepID=A0A7S1P512_9ALVE|mmetsp:Transcript_36657/g.91836  ORF Transcript_36657/g.91836 Transcript_36657/m.91836 type:complete len:299 (+) Transcript_36657:228-1124(+)
MTMRMGRETGSERAAWTTGRTPHSSSSRHTSSSSRHRWAPTRPSPLPLGPSGPFPSHMCPSTASPSPSTNTTKTPPQPQPQPAPAAPLAPSPASSQQTGSTPSPPPSPSKQPPGAPAPPSPSTLSSSSKGSGPGWLATVGHKMQSLAHKTILTPAAAESAADKGAARPSQHEQASASPSAADGDRFDHSNEVVVYVCEGRVRLNWPFEGLDGYRRVRRDGREGYTGVSMDECRAIVRANHRLQFLKRIFFQEDAPDRVTIVLKNDTSFEFEIDNQQEFLNSVKSRLSALNIGMKMSST